MTYQSLEASVHAGAPQELYRFVLGETVWRYTSGQEPVSYAGESYAPAPLRRSAIEQTRELGRAALTLEATEELAVARPFVVSPPDGVLSLTVFRRHVGSEEFIAWWKGRVVAVVFGPGTVRLRCEPIFTSLKRSGLRAHYQITCRHPLYGAGCKVNAADHRVSGVIETVAGTTVSALEFLAQPEGWFVGGRLAAGGAQRLIIESSTGSVTLSAPIPGLAAGLAFEAYPGCDHTLATCAAKFANPLNYGGFPFIPIKNPFAGDAIV
ncbi:DUF2163 domain-containing protein [Pigmentiphaga sp. CHJ604]|uniref:DUF2163 domain-containing protein n=1 Tax=Pigmentiphaga sp. CHJ604 TaxID=3081984 RepID=UPI0030CFEC2A